MDAGVFGQRGLDIGVLVGGVVVAHDVELNYRVSLGVLREKCGELDVGCAAGASGR